jgi:NADH-ubiquinone oxidoreductase chain 5
LPTPVSALIHAATMVTAGVYLLMRTSPLIEYSSSVLILCLWLGAITTVFSSLIGLFQQDIKKVIAYSTMSQLGMMVIAVGLSSYNIALFHLVNHAFYKGLLFLGAGAVIHAVADNQDFRKYGGLRPFLPLTYSVMLIASLSLVAFPFMTGFYSKDFILESAYGQFYFSGTVVYFIATIGAMFTTLYSVKVLYLTFLTNPNGPLVNYKHAHEGDIFMSLPLIILAILSIFFGYITKDIFIGLGSGFFADNSLFIHPTHEIMLNTEFAVPTLFKLLPLFFTISLSIIAIVISEFLGKILITFKYTRLGYNIFGFFNQRFLIELFYNKYITGLIFKLGGQTTKVIDKGSVELLGPYGLEKGLINLSKNIVSLDTGVITSYALYILIGLIFYILIPYLSLFDNSLLLLILLSLFSVVNIYTYNNSVKIVANKQSSMTYLLDPDTLIGITNVLGDKIVPMVQSNIKIATNNVLPILKVSYDTILPILKVSSDTILPVLNKGIDTISYTMVSNLNTIHTDKMEFLAKNYIHILNMKNIAIDLLYSKSITYSSYVPQNFNFNKCIPLLERSYISLTCSWGHFWSINTSYIYTVWLNLHQYILYLIPLLGSLFYGVGILLFNLFEMCLHYLNPLWRFFYYIISNSILLIVKLIELLFLLYTYIKNNGLRPSLGHLIILFLGRLDYYINYYLGYLRICLYCNRFLSFDEYNRYISYDTFIHSSINNLIELIRVRSELIRRLQGRVSQDIYIISHSNPRWNSPQHGRHILSLQVTNRYRLHAVNLNGQIRTIVALYVASGNTQAQRTLLVQLLNADRQLSRVNPNYISEFLPLFNELFVLEQTLSRIFVEDSSNDFNNFIVFFIYEDGHIRPLYTWFFH